jgi:hypothetical protein
VCAAFGDRRPKAVKFCSLCGSWICDECRGKWTWRAVAALKKRLYGST